MPALKCGFLHRRAFTVAELTVVIAIAGFAGSVIGLTLLRQQRFYRGATELLHSRAEVRDALDVMATDIRGLSPADSVSLMADSAIEFFAGIGVGVVWGKESANAVRLPASVSPHGNTLTSFLAQPDTGDIAVFLVPPIDGGSQWERYRIAAFSASEAGQYVVTLARALAPEVKVGTAVRFIRRGRYSLYRSSDGDWYLGFRRCNATGASRCGAIQPLSGPYRSYSTNPGVTGLLFEYFDKAGTRLGAGSSPLSLARVDVTVRAESRQRILFDQRQRGFADSAKVSVSVRNALE